MGPPFDIGVMRFLVTCVLFFGCSRPNPNLCCVDEADCTANGIAQGSTCDDGRVCRGNICIVQECATTAECDAAAPYCVEPPAGTCQEECSDDTQCPGFGGDPEQRFCEAGACAECRTAAECTTAEPVCAAGRCMTCSEHEQCSSGVCTSTGTCANEAEIAHVNVIGSVASDCTRSAPCTSIERALGLTPPRPYLLISTGTYAQPAPIILRDTRWLIGKGTPLPVLRRTTDGPIVLVQGAANATLERLEITGATGADLNPDATNGRGIQCVILGGAPVISIRDSLIHGNQTSGIRGQNCTISAHRSTFTRNGYHGVEVIDSTVTLDRCNLTNNHTGASLDGGLFQITNNMVTRNANDGISYYSSTSGNRVEFNTIADNGRGFACDQNPPGAFASNIIARNQIQTSTSGCTFPNSIIVDTDIAALKFKSPDATPYDYHLMPGSSAIDMGTISTLDHDIDGDSRPMGAGRDVGADEVE